VLRGAIIRRTLVRGLAALGCLYLALLIPESPPPRTVGAGGQAFVWGRDAFWTQLEARFRDARAMPPAERQARCDELFQQLELALNAVAATNLPPDAPEFDALEQACFQLAPVAATCPERVADFTAVSERLGQLVKSQSERWPADSGAARQRSYRLLYGRRAALEEVLLQSAPATNALEWVAREGPDATPSAVVRGVRLHSGDVLVSRGGAATSALIARGNDFPGNFSHIALVHVDASTRQASVVEAHIESGVGVRSIEEYFADTNKLRVMVLRLRADLPALIANPQLPHQAATAARSNALVRHIPYDFAMDQAEPAKQFCSEVAAAAFEAQGVRLWAGLSHLSSPGVVSWLAALGVRNFSTQEPSDLEYDPQMRIVAEWRDPALLFKDHVDNAVIDVLLEAAGRGEALGYNRWRLPLARLGKAWSVALNLGGKVGPIPEGMSATTALRVEHLKQLHARLAAQVVAGAERFRQEHGYVPPYWELVRLARAARNAAQQ
jgi:hypothetical protein